MAGMSWHSSHFAARPAVVFRGPCRWVVRSGRASLPTSAGRVLSRTAWRAGVLLCSIFLSHLDLTVTACCDFAQFPSFLPLSLPTPAAQFSPA